MGVFRKVLEDSRVQNGLKVVVSLALLVVILSQVGLQETWSTIAEANWSCLLGAFAIYLVGMAVRAFRWGILLSSLGLHIPLWRLIFLYFVGAFFSNVLPTGFGGDVVKMYELSRDGSNAGLAVSTVLMDRLSGLLVLFAMAVVASASYYHLIPLPVIALVLAIAIISWGGLVLLRQRKLLLRLIAPLSRISFLRRQAQRASVQQLYESIYTYSRGALAGSLGTSLVFNLLLIALNYLLALAFGYRIPWIYFFVFVPVISFLLVLPLSLNGLGIREGGYVFLFSQVGVPANVALAMSLSFYAIIVATGLIGGVLYAIQGLRGYAAT